MRDRVDQYTHTLTHMIPAMTSEHEAKLRRPRCQNSIFNRHLSRSLTSHHVGSQNSDFLKDSPFLVRRFCVSHRIECHSGCVNSVCWSLDGCATHLLSCSDDRCLAVSDVFNRIQLESVVTGHTDNIFSCRFLPKSDDKRVISCAGDGGVLYTNFDRVEETKNCFFNCSLGSGPVYDCRPASMDSPHIFLTCSEDGFVRRFDLRQCSNCCLGSRPSVGGMLSRMLSRRTTPNSDNTCCRRNAIIFSPETSITSIDIADGRNPFEMAVGSADGRVRLFDLRNLRRHFARYFVSTNSSECRRRRRRPRRQADRITCLRYNPRGDELLVSFSGDQLHLLKPDSLLPAETIQGIHQFGVPGTTTDETETERQGDAGYIQRIRLRGDWSDTGPSSNPSRASTIPLSHLTNVFQQLGISTVRSGNGDTQSTQSSESTPSTASNPVRARAGRLSMFSINESNSSLSESSADEPCALISSMLDILSDMDSGGQAPQEEHEDNQSSLRSQQARQSDSVVEPLSQHSSGSDGGANDYDDDYYDDEDETILNAQESHDIEPRAMSRSRRLPPNSRLMTHGSSFQTKSRNRAKKFCPAFLRSFTGHRNSRTVIKKCAFYGDKYVMSGSDCGHLFVWDKFTGNIEAMYEADTHVVNCIQPHPHLPILATSGIDHDIKIWIPQDETEMVDEDQWNAVLQQNREMLRISQGTLTVPAPLLLRLLSSISHISRQRDRSGGGNSNNDQSANTMSGEDPLS